MSDPLDRFSDPDGPSPYAPKWIRAAQDTNPDISAADFGADFNHEQKSAEESAAPRTDGHTGIEIEHFRIPRSLEPTLIPQPSSRNRSSVWLVGSVTIAIALSGAGAIAVMANLLRGPITSGLPPDTQRASIAGQPAPQVTKLVLGQNAAGKIDEALPIDMSIEGSREGTVVLVGGIPPGASLSAGHAEGHGQWRIPSAEVDDLMIQPASGFAGAVELTVELRLANNMPAGRGALRLEWVRPGTAEEPRPAGAELSRSAISDAPRVTADATPAPGSDVPLPVIANIPRPAAGEVPHPPTSEGKQNSVVHPLDPEQINALLTRGDELIASGDLAAARLVLRRVAEAGNARGALALAGTYDPTVLEKLPIHGFVPNVALARHWYEKAREFGSPDAPRRLQMLASRKD